MILDELLENELKRLKELDKYEILDTPEESDFDEIVKLASQICDKPISLITLLDQERQWFKARTGLKIRQTPREIAFCNHAIQQDGIMQVEDALLDERFWKNPLVTDDPNIRFYAGVPLVTPNGYKLGTLCVIDNKPGKLSSEQQFALSVLAKQVVKEMESRHKEKQLKISVEAIEEVNKRIKADNELLNKAQTAAKVGWFSFGFLDQTWQCSLGLADLLGISPKQTISYDEFLFFIQPEDQVHFQKAMLNISLDHPRFDVDFRWIVSGSKEPLHLRCRSEVVFDNQGEVNKMVGVMQDISEVMHSQKALEASESRWKFALEGAGEGVWDWCSCTNELFLSPQWKKLLGYTDEELENSIDSWKNLIHPEDVLDVQKHWEDLKQGDKSVITHQHRLKAKDGQYRWVMVRGKVLGEYNSGKSRIIGTVADITEQLETANQIKEQNLHLKRVNSELDHFVYRVSHDLRAPIARVKGLLHIIAQDPKDDMVQDYIKFAEDSLVKQDGFIKDILDYSRNSRMELDISEIDFKALIQEILTDYMLDARSKNIQLTFDVSQQAVFFSDERRLKIIINNLLSNAFKYQQEGDGKVEVSIHASVQHVSIGIKDNGIGIEKKHLPNLGQMFYRATDRQPGSGLGLYILTQSLKQMKGDIRIDSTLGKGTSVKIKIPNGN